MAKPKSSTPIIIEALTLESSAPMGCAGLLDWTSDWVDAAQIALEIVVAMPAECVSVAQRALIDATDILRQLAKDPRREERYEVRPRPQEPQEAHWLSLLKLYTDLHIDEPERLTAILVPVIEALRELDALRKRERSERIAKVHGEAA